MCASAWLRVVALAAAVAVSACGEDERQQEATISAVASVPVESSPSPTPAEPTVWGLFVIVGPGPGKTTPVPALGPGAIDTGMIEGPDAPGAVGSRATRFIDAPRDAKMKLTAEGFDAAGATAQQDDSGAFFSYVLYGRTAPTPAMFQVRAYTPTGPAR